MARLDGYPRQDEVTVESSPTRARPARGGDVHVSGRELVEPATADRTTARSDARRAAQPRAARTATAVLRGRGWMLTTLGADALMLGLAILAAVIGARAARLE